MSPVACSRCGDTAGPMVTDHPRPVCEDCHEKDEAK